VVFKGFIGGWYQDSGQIKVKAPSLLRQIYGLMFETHGSVLLYFTEEDHLLVQAHVGRRTQHLRVKSRILSLDLLLKNNPTITNMA
jgi:endonuclease III-like uncharacterized protein